MIKKLHAAVAGLIIATSAQAGPATTAETVFNLSPKEAIAFISGNLTGMLDMLPAGVLCIPPTLTVADGRNMIVQFLKDNPEMMDKPMTEIAAIVMAKKFPCPETKPEPKAKPKAGKTQTL